MARFFAHRSHEEAARVAPTGDDRPREDLRALAASLVQGSREAMGVYAMRPDDPSALLATSVEERVFEETMGDTAAAVLADHFGPYEHATLLFCVLDQHRQLPAAMLRLILPSRAGLKTLADIEPTFSVPARELFAANDFDYDPNHTWDLATLAVSPEYRAAAFQGTLTMALCQSVSVLGLRLGFPYALAMLHVPVLRMLQWKLGRPFHEFEGVEPQPYLDSPASLPAWMHLPEWHRRLADRDRILFDMMTGGTGLEAAVRPPDWDRAAELAAEVSALADLRLHLR